MATAVQFGLACALARSLSTGTAVAQALNEDIILAALHAVRHASTPAAARLRFEREYQRASGQKWPLDLAALMPLSCHGAGTCEHPGSSLEDAEHPMVKDTTGLCDTVLGGCSCRACGRIYELLRRHLPPRRPPLLSPVEITVTIEEGAPAESAYFGLPFRAAMIHDEHRPKISLSFVEGPLAALPSARDQSGLRYAVWHEIQHALDHAYDRKKAPGQDHTRIFADGWMDQVAADLCVRDMPGDSAEHIRAIRRERLAATDVPDLDRDHTSWHRTLGSGTAQALFTLLCEGCSWDGLVLTEDAFWRLTMALYAGPVALAGRDSCSWRSRVIQRLEKPLQALLHCHEAEISAALKPRAEAFLDFFSKLAAASSYRQLLNIFSDLLLEAEADREDLYSRW